MVTSVTVSVPVIAHAHEWHPVEESRSEDVPRIFSTTHEFGRGTLLDDIYRECGRGELTRASGARVHFGLMKVLLFRWESRFRNIPGILFDGPFP